MYLEDGTGCENTKLMYPEDGTGCENTKLMYPEDGTGCENTKLMYLEDGTGCENSKLLYLEDGTGSENTKLMYLEDGTGCENSKLLYLEDGTGCENTKLRDFVPPRQILTTIKWQYSPAAAHGTLCKGNPLDTVARRWITASSPMQIIFNSLYSSSRTILKHDFSEQPSHIILGFTMNKHGKGIFYPYKGLHLNIL
jgi:hypothetical protein